MCKINKSAAVIVSTYNWPQALSVVLRSLCNQSCSPAEIIIADDGSSQETAAAVEKVMRPTKFVWCHARQEDSGFRQARLRNLGVRFSHAPYLIFIDHDTVPHREFVANHLLFSESGFFLQGKRAFLPNPITQRILKLQGHLFRPPAFWHKGIGNRKNTLYMPRIGRLFMRPKKFQTILRGSNLSVMRKDFINVDGFDELFDGLWGREDSDFCYRLFHSGVRCRNLWFAGLQYHLHHSTSSKRRERDRLDEELDRVRSERRTKAVRGFSNMDDEGQIINASIGYAKP